MGEVRNAERTADRARRGNRAPVDRLRSIRIGLAAPLVAIVVVATSHLGWVLAIAIALGVGVAGRFAFWLLERRARNR